MLHKIFEIPVRQVVLFKEFELFFVWQNNFIIQVEHFIKGKKVALEVMHFFCLLDDDIIKSRVIVFGFSNFIRFCFVLMGCLLWLNEILVITKFEDELKGEVKCLDYRELLSDIVVSNE